MKITHIFLFYSLFAINLSYAMERRFEQEFQNAGVNRYDFVVNVISSIKNYQRLKETNVTLYNSLSEVDPITKLSKYQKSFLENLTEQNFFDLNLYVLNFVNDSTNLEKMQNSKSIVEQILLPLKKINTQMTNLATNNLLMSIFLNPDWAHITFALIKSEIFDLNYQNDFGETIFSLACVFGNFELIKVLLQYNVNLHLKTSRGNTNLMIAAKHGHTKIVKLLLDHGADITVKNMSGKTALMIAQERGHKEIEELINTSYAKLSKLAPEIMAKIVDNLLDDAENSKASVTDLVSNLLQPFPSNPSNVLNSILKILQKVEKSALEKYVDATKNLLDRTNYKIFKHDNNESDLVNVIADEDLIIDRIYLRMKKSDPKITKLHVAIYLKNILWIKKNINNINSDDILTADAQSMVPLNLAIDKGNKTLFDILVEKLKKEPSTLSFAQVLVLAINKPNRIYYTESLINSNLISAADILAKDTGTNENALILTIRKSVEAQNTTTYAQNTTNYLRLFRSLMQILNNQLSSPDLQELLQLSLHVDAPRAVEYLLDNNMITSQHILAKNLEGLDCLMMAIEKDRLILFKHFLRLGNNFNGNFDGALLYACAWNASNVVEFLLKNNYIKDVDIQDSEGNTPLIMAAKNLSDIRKYSDRSERTKYIIKLLTDFGANTYKMNNKGESAVSIASDYAPDLLSRHNTVDQNTTVIDIMLKYIGWRK